MVAAVRIFGSVSTGLLVIVLGRLLGPAQYGLYSLALATAVAAVSIADQGIPAATKRFIAETYPDTARMRGTFLRGLAAKTRVVAVVAVIVFVLAGPLADALSAPSAATLMRIGAVTVLAQDIYAFLAASFIAVRRTIGSATIAITKATVEFVTAVVLVLAGAGAAGGMIGNATGYLIADTAGIVLLVRVIFVGGDADRNARPASRKEIRAYGRQVWVAEVIFAGFGFVDQFFLQGFLGATAVGIYAVAWRMIVPLQHFGIAFSLTLNSRLSTLTTGERSITFERGVRGLVAFYAGGGVLCLVIAQPAMRTLFGANFSESGTVFAALAPLVVMTGVGPMLADTLNVLGRARDRKWVTAATITVNIVGDLLLIPLFGVVGPALASDAAYVVFVFGHFVLCRRVVAYDPARVVRSALLGVVAGLGGAALILLVLAAPLHPELVRVGAAAVIGLAGMLAGLVVLREWDRGLLAILRQ
jgi:O-antigen/teichoic acid export membrane protein